MSLAVLADHMASKGRGPDSMLIHMSPREVQGLQALAMKNGGSLTVNPETGLPEAGFLDKLLPAIIGFALAPMTAGTSLAFLGATPMASALTVGGLQALRTGDIGKGISAGLGAYGGAGLQAGLATAGANALSGEATSLAANEAGRLAGEEAVRAGVQQGLSEETINQLRMQAIEEAGNATARVATDASPFEKLSAGFDAAKTNPSSLLTKDNFKYAAAAAGPILADQAVTSKLPVTATKPGMIRPYSYDPYGGTYTAGTPYEAQEKKAADGGLMGLAAGGMASYGDGDDVPRRVDSGGIFDFTQRSEPVARMAEGGIAGYATGGVSDADIFKYFQTPNLSDAQIAADMQKYGVSAADIARATGTQDQQANYEQRFVNTLVSPTTDAAEFQKATQAVGLQDQGLTNAMQGAGLSQGAQYALTQPAMSDAGFTGGIIDAGTGKPVELYNQLGYTAGALPGDQAGLEGLYGNINYVTSGLQNLINTGKMSVADAQNAALAELSRTGVSVGDVKAATGKDFGSLFRPKTATSVVPPVVTPIALPKTIIPGINDYGLGGTGTSGALESVYGPALPPGVSGAGVTTVNPNGTITTRPDLSLQMKDVRDTYERGGGSLGVNKNLFAPKTQDELFARYKNTGGSKAALDYLMGKTPYDPTPSTKTGEIMKPYWESVGKIPAQENNRNKKYVFVNGKYELNPGYVKPSYVLAGEKAAALSNQDKEPTDSPGAGNKWVWNSVDKNWEAKPIGGETPTTGQNDGGGGGDANGGLMKLAGGGMSGQFNLGDYSDGGRLLRGPGDGVSDSIPASIGGKRPARLADGEFVVPARIVSELGNGSTEAGARKLYAMMDRVQAARKGSIGKGKVAKNSRADKYLPA